ncbi:sodium/potassium/calcium exchanger 3, partial [Elysia marginata]
GGGYRKSSDNSSECKPLYDEDYNEIRIMSYDAFINGGLLVHVLIGMYTFAAIAAICDIYFVPALEHICEDLKLEADVAGATFMAAASSAPEFCTSVIGIFVQENDVGLGAIVGSSIFNLLAIVGLCGIFAGMNVELSWYPLTRDSIFYTVAVFEMLAFMYDASVHWYEALVMIMTYALYILVMVYNKKIEQLTSASEPAPASRTSSILKDMHKTHSARLEIIRARSHSRVSMHNISESRLKQLSMIQHSTEPSTPHGQVRESDCSLASTLVSQARRQIGALISRTPSTISKVKDNLSIPHPNQDHAEPPNPLGQARDSFCSLASTLIEGTSADPKKMALHVVVEEPSVVGPESAEELPPQEIVSEAAVAEYENPLDFPEGWSYRIYWIVVLPVTVLHAYTIPDSRIQNSWQSRFYMIPFTLSVFYLAVYSYIMVWAMSVAAWGLSIPATVTGLTILAAGTSVPDCLSSIFVARDGYGDMAVSNAIGSNVFDILLCLGVPWLVTGIWEDGHSINSEGMWVAGSTLVFTIIYLIVSLRLCNWTLTPMYGFFTLLFYMVVITFCILVELNILFELHKEPMC